MFVNSYDIPFFEKVNTFSEKTLPRQVLFEKRGNIPLKVYRRYITFLLKKGETGGFEMVD